MGWGEELDEFIRRRRGDPRQQMGVDDMPAPASRDLQAWSIGNWQLIPAVDRKRCLDHLKAVFSENEDVVERWRRQVADDQKIGSDDTWFHFGTGMEVRNILREMLPDHTLPMIPGSNHTQKNWDDFYIGAIHAMVTEKTDDATQKG